MKCPSCEKTLNGITIICDNCGEIINDDATEISFQDVVSKIASNGDVNQFSKALQDALTEGLYLSKRVHDVSYPVKFYYKKTLEFIIFWIYYETHKKYLLTDDFTTQEALDIFETLDQGHLNEGTKELLEKEYPDNFENLTIPKSAFKGVKHPYMLKTKYPQYRVSNIIFSYLTLLFKHFLSYAILFLAITFGIYALNSILEISSPLINQVINTQEYLIIIASIGGLYGLINKRKSISRLPVKQFKDSHPALSKHINTHAKNKIKSLKAREEKE
ncbi:MAG: hypothetical protein UMR38_07210 [Candidatus Izemoplasma sp.]|nr:hypothetical protein [Candidatus Izemoplasma sp.]